MNYRGHLYHLTLENCKLITEEGEEIDLYPIIDKFLSSIDGKNASHEEGKASYTLCVDSDSEFIYHYDSDPDNEKLRGLQKTSGIGWSNVDAHLDMIMIWINGRLINIKISEDQLHIEADPSEEVFGVYFVEGNFCAVPEGAEETICKIGQNKETCIFSSWDSGTGWGCLKFDPYLARQLLDRLAKGKINAGRIGDCALLGRKEEPVPQEA
ncbi:hypothetical protein ACFL24_00905 [Patescibacteria group bacterium]